MNDLHQHVLSNNLFHLFYNKIFKPFFNFVIGLENIYKIGIIQHIMHDLRCIKCHFFIVIHIEK